MMMTNGDDKKQTILMLLNPDDVDGQHGQHYHHRHHHHHHDHHDFA